MRKNYVFIGIVLLSMISAPAISLAVSYFSVADNGTITINGDTNVTGDLTISGSISAANLGGTADNFDSYATTTSVSGLSGGSGWNGNWIKTGGGSYGVVDSPTYTGARAAYGIRDGSGTGRGYRAINLGGHVLMHAAVRQTSTTTPYGGRIQAYTSTDNTSYGIHFNSGKIVLKSTDGDIDLMNFDADKWYVVELEVNSASNRNRARAKAENGTFTEWTSWVRAWEGTETTAVNKFDYATAGTDTYTMYVDDVQVSAVQ